MTLPVETSRRWRRGLPLLTVSAAAATVTGALTILPLFDGLSVVGPMLLVIAVVAATGYACRALGLPVALHPIAATLAWLTMLTWLFVLPAAAWWVLPGPAAIEALQALAAEGIDQAEVLTAPVPAEPGLVLLAAAGVGIIAITVDVVAVSLRLPALSGVPLLVLASLPIAVLPSGLSWWLLPLAASGWLLLLAVDARLHLRSWGRLASIPRQQRQRPVGAGPSAHQRAPGFAWLDPRMAVVGVIALAIAALLPQITPGLGEPVWGTGRGPSVAGGVAGDGPLNLDPFVSLRRSLVSESTREVLAYTTDAQEPGYLRMVTLTEFDGVTWRPDDNEFRIPLTQPLPPPVRDEGTPVEVNSYDIQVNDLVNPALPVPFAATSVRGQPRPLSDEWGWEPATRTVTGDGTSAAGLSYTVTAYDVQPDRTQLRAAGSDDDPALARLTELPSNLTPRVAELAREVTAGESTAYDQAVALEKWFTVDGGFTYSTSITAGAGPDPVEAFLDERVGYCEQYAATMALMARTLGIPSRVNVGFTAGTMQEDGSWSVKGRNAHAWPELYFEGVGWVWFEPTPRSEGDAGVTAPSYSQVPDRSNLPADQITEPPIIDVDPGISGADASTGESAGLPWPVLIGFVALLGIVAVGATPALIRTRRRRARLHGADRVEGAWAEVTLTVAAHGLQPPHEMTPRGYVAWLREAVQFDDRSWDYTLRLLWWVEQQRYAGGLSDSDTPTPHNLHRVVSSISTAVAASAPRWSRWKAWWTVSPTSTGSSHAQPVRDDQMSGVA